MPPSAPNPRRTALQELALFGNKIGSGGAVVIADALKSNTSLQTLVLNDCGLDDSSGTALGEMLAVNQVP